MSYTRSSRAGEVVPPRIKAWSFSRLKDWTQCPFKIKCSAIDRLPQPETPQMLGGKRVHKAAEDYIKGVRKDVDPALKHFANDLQQMRCAGAMAEVQVAFAEDLQPANWFGSNAWLRVIYDVFIANDDASCYVGDWKSGKQRPEDKEQLELFALSVFLSFAEVKTVHTELLYTTTGATLPQTFERQELDDLKAKWFGKAAPMLADTEFLPRPNGLCGWCHYRKSNGGPCIHS